MVLFLVFCVFGFGFVFGFVFGFGFVLFFPIWIASGKIVKGMASSGQDFTAAWYVLKDS